MQRRRESGWPDLNPLTTATSVPATGLAHYWSQTDGISHAVAIVLLVGLLGTVWGIYHALNAVSASGTVQIDRVAGPVGEALIMTAFGLTVAIPAVLAYNAFTRVNRVTLAELDAFAYDLHAYLTTGARVGE